MRPGGLLEGSVGLPGGPRGGQMDKWTYRWTDVWIDRRNFSPNYRTLSPVGAATHKEGGEEENGEDGEEGEDEKG